MSITKLFIVVEFPVPPYALSLKVPLLYFSLTHPQFPPLKQIIVPDLYSSALHHYFRVISLSFHIEELITPIYLKLFLPYNNDKSKIN